MTTETKKEPYSQVIQEYAENAQPQLVRVPGAGHWPVAGGSRAAQPFWWTIGQISHKTKHTLPVRKTQESPSLAFTQIAPARKPTHECSRLLCSQAPRPGRHRDVLRWEDRHTDCGPSGQRSREMSPREGRDVGQT